MLAMAVLVSDSVRASEPLTEALKKPVEASVKVMESEAEPSRLIAFVVLSLSVSASEATPWRKELA
jgi:hypothetical protein